MPFPQSPRVIYGQNPLIEVICQLRFAPVLRIAAELPAGFQERIRGRYPLFEQKIPEQQLELPPAIAKQVKIQLGAPGAVAYEFATDDEEWAIVLARDSLSLSTSNYRRWEEFRSNLSAAWKPFVEEYAPGKLTRIGLRYRDVIQRSEVGLTETPWQELLQPYIASELAAPGVRGEIEQVAHQIVIRLPEHDGRVRVQHGFATNQETKEECYLIDSDFYSERKTDPADAQAILDYFNQQSGRLFRWCITPRLHEAMRPTDP
jgi:uncharacterized protein (TIGR04255 family)